MKLATIAEGGRDGVLAVVSGDGTRLAPAGAPNLQAALEDWDAVEPELRAAAGALDAGELEGRPIDSVCLHSPMPRAYQWAEASTYHRHMERLRAVRGIGLPPDHGRTPAVYQSFSDVFLRPDEEIPLADVEWGLDCEATVGVIVSGLPLGASRSEVEASIRLLTLTNDLTHRNLLTREYATGVGFYQAKPARAYAPFAVTPDELGDAWKGGLLSARVEVEINGDWLGSLDSGSDCSFDFHRILLHMATTRELGPGSIIGSGTVANDDPARGHGCIAEKRSIDIAAGREPSDRFLEPGDRVRIEAFDHEDLSIFGAIDQRVIDPGLSPAR